MNTKPMGQVEGFGDGESWPLTEDQSVRFQELFLKEQQDMAKLAEGARVMRSLQLKLDLVADSALASREGLDLFCKQLEQDLKIPPGTRWFFNPAKNRIEARK